MSYPQNVDGAGQPPRGVSSIRRAREQALAASGQRESFNTYVMRMGQPSQGQQGQQQQAYAQTTQRIPIPARPSNPEASRIPIPKSQAAADLQSPQTPQWPLAGSPAVTSNLDAASSQDGASQDAEPYRPPRGRVQPPQRPPRPVRVPSFPSGANQDQTPMAFPHNAVTQAPGAGAAAKSPKSLGKASARESSTSMARQSTASSASRTSYVSSVGSIPDFPVPAAGSVAIPIPPPVAAVPAPRRSVNLGPPPSARRGASSFYSNASHVSPIPEESPRTRSHGSFASSAAMPENWASPSLTASPNYTDDASFYDDIPEEPSPIAGGFDDDGGSRSGAGSLQGDRDGDERQLVRSASIGKRGRASLITTGVKNADPASSSAGRLRNAPPDQSDSSSSSSASTVRNNKDPVGASLTADNVLNALNAAAATDPFNPSRRLSVSPQPPVADSSANNGGPSRPYSRLSAIRRPPRLDIDAVRDAEARGSLTSLPDLIRRATRLAASLDRGRRPASRFDDLDLSPGMLGRDANRGQDGELEKHQSGLSDMLAAFPPPAQANRRGFRQSLRDQVGSWPLPLGANALGNQPIPEDAESNADVNDPKASKRQRKGRRCCGLPLWGFVLVVIAVLVIVAAAIVIPLEFFVIRKQNAAASASLTTCQNQLTCANGGTNVVSTQGVCSCICTNDFTGFDCSVAGDNGCTTMTLASSSTTGRLSGVTLGDALPRLIEQAQQNFSIPLSGTEILAVFNSANLSCAAENALVTFDGESARQSSGTAAVNAYAAKNGIAALLNNGSSAGGMATATVTVEAPTTVIVSPTGAGKAKRADGDSGAGGGASVTKVTVTTGSAGSDTLATASAPASSATTTTTVTTTITPTRTASKSSGTATSTVSSAVPSTTFTVTENTLDFARVAVLYILQQESLENAESAQSTLQRFFTLATTGAQGEGPGVTIDQARNLTLTSGNSINLVDLQVDAANMLLGANIPT